MEPFYEKTTSTFTYNTLHWDRRQENLVHIHNSFLLVWRSFRMVGLKYYKSTR